MQNHLFKKIVHSVQKNYHFLKSFGTLVRSEKKDSFFEVRSNKFVFKKRSFFISLSDPFRSFIVRPLFLNYTLFHKTFCSFKKTMPISICRCLGAFWIVNILEKRVRRSIDNSARQARNAIYSDLKARFQRQTGSSDARCRTFFETSCTTKYVEKAPGQMVADTSCEKIPVELCGLGKEFFTRST